MSDGEARRAYPVRTGRVATGVTPPAQDGSIPLRYLEAPRILVRGSATGRQYDFSADRPVQPVDRRDAAQLVQTRLFRPG